MTLLELYVAYLNPGKNTHTHTQKQQQNFVLEEAQHLSLVQSQGSEEVWEKRAKAGELDVQADP